MATRIVYGIYSLKLEDNYMWKMTKKPTITTKESLQNNWARLLNISTTIQLVENNWTGEVIQQHVILEQVTTKKTLEEIMKNIDKQILETKYTLNLG